MFQNVIKAYGCKDQVSIENLQSVLEEQQNLLFEFEKKLKELSMRYAHDSNVLPLTSNGLSWTGDPIYIGFVKSAPGIQSFPLPETLPVLATQIRVSAFHRSGNEGPDCPVLYRLWTDSDIEGSQDVHFLYGCRYGQNAVSFQSPEFWFKLTSGTSERVLKASTDSVQASNDHGIQLFVSAYKL